MINGIGIFDFSKDQLMPIVSGAVSEKVIDFSLRLEEKKTHSEVIMGGIQGDYLIPVFTCRTESGITQEIIMFVRRRNDNDIGHYQAYHYSFLRDQGIRVPVCYGTLIDKNNREVLFLEHLDSHTVSKEGFFNDHDALVELLELMARFNAVQLTVDYAARLGWDMAERGFTQNWKTWILWAVYVLNFIEQQAERDVLGGHIKNYCQANKQELQKLKSIALELAYLVPAFPVGYIHHDFHPGNTGWRKKPRELVVFDFEDVLLDTRFYDIASVIGGWDVERSHSAKQQELADIYLKVWGECSGKAPGMDAFLREITLVWYARKMNLWEYLPPDLLNAPSYESGMPGRTRQERLELVHKNLAILIDRMNYVGILMR